MGAPIRCWNGTALWLCVAAAGLLTACGGGRAPTVPDATRARGDTPDAERPAEEAAAQEAAAEAPAAAPMKDEPPPPPPAPTIADEDELDALTIPQLPVWTDRYRESQRGDGRRFRISAIMARFGWNRLQAVEVQNHYLDLSFQNPNGAPVEHFNAALERVHGGNLESGLKAEDLERAPFIVVFDLDETLYDQYRSSEACSDYSVERSGGTGYVKLNPGWEAIIRKVYQLGGRVVLFSANLDELTWENLDLWMLDGAPIAQSNMVSGVMTNAYLIQQTRDEGKGANNPQRGFPVLEPSKDLRMFDESLEKVIIVDDNPIRLFQMANVRVFPKFHANTLCKTQDAGTKALLEQGLRAVGREIEDSVAYMQLEEVSFARAYLPYTENGRIVVDGLMAANEWTKDQAIDYVRSHPEIVPAST